MGRKSEYTQEFQDNAVKMVVADGMLYAVAARQLKITLAELRSWVHRWKRDSKLAQETGKDSVLQELLELRKENEDLREANEILEKQRHILRKACSEVCLDIRAQASPQHPKDVQRAKSLRGWLLQVAQAAR